MGKIIKARKAEKKAAVAVAKEAEAKDHAAAVAHTQNLKDEVDGEVAAVKGEVRKATEAAIAPHQGRYEAFVAGV